MINKKNAMISFNFFITTILQNKKFFFWGLVASFIFSILFFNFQKKDLQIIKSLVPASNMSKVSALLKKTKLNSVGILEEYIYILKRGLPKSEFFETIKENQDITDDEIEKKYINFLKFKDQIQLEKMRLYRKYPMYNLTYSLQLSNDDQENVSSKITEANDYLVENFNILNKLVKKRVINFYIFNFENNKSEKVYDNDGNIDYFEFQQDDPESFLITKNSNRISEKNIEQVKVFFKNNERLPLIEGLDSYQTKIIKTKLDKIIPVAVLIFLAIFYLFFFFKLTNTKI